MKNFVDKKRMPWQAFREAEYDSLSKLIASYENHITKSRCAYTQANNENNAAQQPLNIFFSTVNKLPIVTVQRIYEAFNFPPNTLSKDLTTDIKSIFEEIVKASQNRLEKDWAVIGVEYKDSVSQIFLAEFADWLKKMLTKSADEEAREQVVERMQYLFDILDSPIFNDESPSSYQMHAVILSILEALQNKVLKTIDYFIKQQCARDHFLNLVNNTRTYICDMVNTTFDLFNCIDTDVNFDFNMYDIHSAKEEHQRLLKSRLGELVQRLTSIKIFLTLGTKIPLEAAKINFFLTEKGEVNSLICEQTIKKPKNKYDIPTGIVDVLEYDVYVTLLVTVFADFNSLGLTVGALRKVFELSGPIGDVGLYVTLKEDTEFLIQHYIKQINKLEEDLKNLEQTVFSPYKICVLKRDHEAWRRKFYAFKRTTFNSKTQVALFKDTVAKIYQDIQKANSEEYGKEVQEQINEFKQLVSAIKTNSYVKNDLGQNDVSERELLPSNENDNNNVTGNMGLPSIAETQMARFYRERGNAEMIDVVENLRRITMQPSNIGNSQ